MTKTQTTDPNERQFFHTKSKFDVFHIAATEPSSTGFYYAECNWGIRPANDVRITRDAIPAFAKVCPRCSKKVGPDIMSAQDNAHRGDWDD